MQPSGTTGWYSRRTLPDTTLWHADKVCFQVTIGDKSFTFDYLYDQVVIFVYNLSFKKSTCCIRYFFITEVVCSISYCQHLAQSWNPKISY
jgi:hypothetical protein